MTSLRSNSHQLELFRASNRPHFDARHHGELRISGQSLTTTAVFQAYWYFAAERQNIFYRRLRQATAGPLTADPILSDYKFTNAYRASDRASQYLIRHVIYRPDLPDDPDELFFRIMLFKVFNSIATWRYLEQRFGALTLANFSYSDFDRTLRRQKDRGYPIYSAAYMMPTARAPFGHRLKHQNHLRLIEYMLDKRFPAKLRSATSFAECYETLRSAPSIGPFLAFQYAIDLNYSTLIDYPESDFVVAGPGALDGIAKCFIPPITVGATQIINHMYLHQDRYFGGFSHRFESLWGRPLQPVDCQNIFCEVSKYSRIAFPHIIGVARRRRIKQRYNVRNPLPRPWYPPKWQINSAIDADSTITV